MIWREIRQTDEYLEHVAEIWRKERRLPRWFRNASSTWTRDEREFKAFCDDCAEIFALFDDRGRLVACVYVEAETSPGVLSIHLSIVEKIPPEMFVEKAGELRGMLLRRGARSIRGWILGKNRALARLMFEIGFRDTGVSMRHGASHGAVLRWNLFELRRG
ncbi:MAG TPA: hypothetical protein VIL74_09085 [Pyrinomonadaceae bacterium]|jgi:hypothetical protein